MLLRNSGRFSGFIILATAIIIALDLLGVNVMPFIAGAGVAGVAIGFAAKDTLSNLIAGILLIIDRPFEVGDRIEVWSAPAGTATWGDVIDIGCTRFPILTDWIKTAFDEQAYLKNSVIRTFGIRALK